MIKLSEKLLVKADVQKVWAFLTDVEKSLSFNRFHIDVILTSPFSVNNNSEFTIIHNFGFGNIDMTAKVIDCIPVKRISISEKPTDNASRGFMHEIIFEIYSEGKDTILNYSVTGTYGGRVQNISFTPILKGVRKKKLLELRMPLNLLKKFHKILKLGVFLHDRIMEMML